MHIRAERASQISLSGLSGLICFTTWAQCYVTTDVALAMTGSAGKLKVQKPADLDWQHDEIMVHFVQQHCMHAANT